jgi:hypothetical protein
MNKLERQREWEDALELMTEEELEFVLAHPVGYYPSFLEMVSAKLWDLMEDPYSVAENKAMMNTIISIIEGLGSKCEIDEDVFDGFPHGSAYGSNSDRMASRSGWASWTRISPVLQSIRKTVGIYWMA